MRRSAILLSIAGLLCTASAASAAAANTCVFTLSMISGTDVNNLDLKVDYSRTGGNVQGTPTHPECSLALGGKTLASFGDNDASSVLSAAIIRLSYFSAPTALAGCRIFYDSLAPLPSDFTVTVTNASRDGEDAQVVPTAIVRVTSVECPGVLPDGTTTTTLPDTTTTLPGGDRCGFPTSDGEKPAASDALYVLQASVGTTPCELCVCDVNNSGNVATGDALIILRAAVGFGTEFNCPPC